MAGTTILVNAVDVTTKVVHGSLTSKFNTVDFQLFNPAAAPTVGQSVALTDPTWSGTISSVTSKDPVDLRNSQVIYVVTATNALTLPADTAPFDLNDVPVTITDKYLLEDGSGHYLLEDGTDWALNPSPSAYLLEGTYSKGYSGLSVQVRSQASGPNLTLGRCHVIAKGLRPGNQFNLTSLNQGYAAMAFKITQVTTHWPTLSGDPQFEIEFGDTPQTLALWTTQTAPAPIAPITPPSTVPSGPVIYGQATSVTGIQTMGGGIVTVASGTVNVSAPAGHTLTVQIVGLIDCLAYAWDNYVAVPRRAVRAILSGGIYTGAWIELPGGWTGGSTAGFRQTVDVSSAPGIALASGSYTVSLQINTVESNQLQIFSGFVQASVTTV